MSIDLFTFIAQIVNFLILVWILKKFLFGRIVQAMKDREDSIAKRLNDADALQREAEAARLEWQRKSYSVDEQASSLLAEAKHQAEEARKKLLQGASDEVAQKRAAFFKDLETERAQLMQRFRVEMGKQVFDTSNHLLLNIANVSLHSQIGDCFLERIPELPDAQKSQLAQAIEGESGRLAVHSSVELDSDAQSRWNQSLRETFPTLRQIDFEMLPPESIGIELRTEHYSVPWTLQSHIEGMEERVLPELKRGPNSYA